MIQSTLRNQDSIALSAVVKRWLIFAAANSRLSEVQELHFGDKPGISCLVAFPLEGAAPACIRGPWKTSAYRTFSSAGRL
jgi:hypothetical protein